MIEIVRPLDRPLVKSEAIGDPRRQSRGRRAPPSSSHRRRPRCSSTRALRWCSTRSRIWGEADRRPRSNDVTPQSVMVLRNAGADRRARHAGSRCAADPKKLGLQGPQGRCGFSDARMSGTAFGTVILHVAPEAAAGGPLALIRDGDVVKLDVKGRRTRHEGGQHRTRQTPHAVEGAGKDRRAATCGSTPSASPRPTRAAISISSASAPAK